MTNELTDLRRRLAQAEALALTLQQQRDQAESTAKELQARLQLIMADAAWWHATVANYVTSATTADREILRDTMAEALRDPHPGASILAVAEAARAYVQANDYDNLADLLIALKGAVDRWER